MRMLTTIFFAALALTACQRSPRESTDGADSTTAVGAPQLRDELISMARVDRELRSDLTVERMQDSTFAARLLASQQEHAARMNEVLDAHGWPGPAMVGADGVEAAWLLVQHGGPDLQLRALRLIRGRAGTGVSPPAAAMLEDRVRVGQGKRQRYGTQFSVEDGRLVLDPLENPDSIDVWRERVGLGPLDEYLRQAREALGVAADSAGE